MTVEAKPDLREFRSAQRYFRRHFAELRERYHGEYIAIVGGEVRHHARQRGEVAAWVRRNLPGRPVYVPFVGDEPSVVLHSPSARVVVDHSDSIR